MNDKLLIKLRNFLNRKEGINNFKITYNDTILINDKFKNFFNINCDEESLSKIYKLLGNYIKNKQSINEDSKLRKFLDLNKDEKINNINIYNYFNKLLINNLNSCT